MGEGAWEAFPEEARQLLTANCPALLAELDYVDEDMPDADEFASIEVPALLVAVSDSPAPQREMTDAMAKVLPNAHAAPVVGGHLIDPRDARGPRVRRRGRRRRRTPVTRP